MNSSQEKTIQLFYESVIDKENNIQLGELVSQLLIDLYDYHLITCCNCGAIHNQNKDDTLEYHKGPNGDDDERYQYRKCISCNDVMEEQDNSDLFY